MAVPVKLKDEVSFAELETYGFFYWGGNNAYWYVMNTHTANSKNVEISVQIDSSTREVKVVATNDHKKLPSIYNKKYTKDNYLEFEDEIDQYSFSESLYPYIIVRLVQDGLIHIPKYKRHKTDTIIAEDKETEID